MRTLLYASLLLALAPAARADVTLPKVFGSHMVLQRDKPVAIWGWAAPGEKVTVRLGDTSGVSADATAAADGFWKVTLPPMKANAKGQTLTAEGKTKVTLEDVLIGEVWLGSGQSNMEWKMSDSADPAKTIAAAKHPLIRLLHVRKEQDKSPRKDIPVTAPWTECTPASVKEFSAVLYHFGVRIQKELDVPVGLINSSWGGSPIEPWLHEAKGNGGMYNAMIAPIAPLSMRGLLWYQGESNMGSGMAYRAKTETLVTGWRKAFGQDLPFYYVQIAPYSGYNPMLTLTPTTKGWKAADGKVRIPLAGLARLDHKDGKVANQFQATAKVEAKTKWVPAEAAVEKDELVISAKGVESPAAVQYSNDLLPEFWEAQCACLTIPGTGMAGTTDIVHNVGDIHPKNKYDVGNRLARWALARTYGKKDVVVSGPLYKGLKVDGNKAVVSFAHAGAGLKSRDDKALTEFEIAGADGKFYAAQATIDGDKVVVSSREVEKPTQVRFGWRKLANPNLVNSEGLPAYPFRSQGWKGATGEAAESAAE